jgi:hypothetical protein
MKKNVKVTEVGAKKKVNAKAAGKVARIQKIIEEPMKRNARKCTTPNHIIKAASKSTKMTVFKASCCVVVYTTGDYEYFRTEEMARKQRGCLPGSVVTEYRLFASKQEATEFMDATDGGKRPGATKQESTIVTPTKVADHLGDSNANLPIKALNKIGLSRLEAIDFSTFGSGVASKYIDRGPTTVSSSYLANLKKVANSGQVEIQIHIFKYGLQPQPNYQVVTFELYDLKQSKKYWTHHGEKWEQAFQNAKQNNFGDMYDDVCYQFKSFVLRNVTTRSSGMQNEPLVFDGVRQDGSHYQIEEHGLYLLLPFDYTPEQVKEQINLFGVNASKLIAMQAYDALHNSPNTALRQNVKPVSGGYWSMLQIAFDSELKIIVEDTLDNMFLDQEIYTLMGALFNIFDHPKDYGNSDLINFAYGRVTAFDGKN